MNSADRDRRDALAAAVVRVGLRLTVQPSPGDLRIEDLDERIELSVDATTARLSPSIEPSDLAAVAGIVVELAALRRTVRALEAQHSIGLVTSIVAHDVRNVLVSMHYAADALVAHDDPTTAQFAQILVEGCQHISAMLRRISHAPSGRPQRIDVNALVQDLAPTLHGLVVDRAHLVTRLESPLPAVWMDASDLERALVNLVVNARDANRPGGRVVLSTSTRVADGARWVVIDVTDEGCGMDPATLARACEPFYTTKAAQGGSGLGLASVSRAATDARGRVELESEPERGTSARLWLPVS